MVFKHGGYQTATFLFGIENFYLYMLLVKHGGHKASHTARTYDGDLVQLGVVALHQIFTEIINILG